MLLLQAQLLALVGAVVRVQHRRQRLCALPRQDGLHAQRSMPHCRPCESVIRTLPLQEEAAHRKSLSEKIHSSYAGSDKWETRCTFHSNAEGLQGAQKCLSAFGASINLLLLFFSCTVMQAGECSSSLGFTAILTFLGRHLSREQMGSVHGQVSW